jgi:ATP-dependent exoDNAse (exonuclease V) beta subunit
VPLDAAPVDIEALTGVQARLLGSSAAEAAAASAIALATLQHPLLAAAREAVAAQRSCLREVPISTVVDGVLIDGQADLAFEEEGGWVVVDFKTDAEIGGAAEPYRRQVALYAAAIARSTGHPARGVLLRV